MAGRKRLPEQSALYLLEQILAIDKADRDALPGSVVSLVKQARRILIKRAEADRR